MTILVFGSLNMDLVVRSPRLPSAGETILGSHFATIPGGKGANQAVAVARQQVDTVMVGRVGADSFGHQLRHALAVDGVAVEAVKIDAEVPTGIAAIAVADNGENHIVVVPGANGQVDQTEVSRLQSLLPQAQLLLMQFELPLSVVTTAAVAAYQAGVTVIVDPAPAQVLALEHLYHHTHILTPNQVEASQLVDFPVNTVEQAIKAATILRQRGVAIAIVKLGEQGVVCATAEETFHTPALAVSVVDTVAAGDAFNGGLAVALQAGKPIKAAIAWATATAALSVTQPGAQPSMPTRSQVEAFLAVRS
ncbi:MAG: ribokinase [Cyanobacteria bacterium P01_H01_bin.58]